MISGGLISTGIVTATDLSYVRHLMSKNYEAVGFLPAPRLAEYATRGQVLLQKENNDPCGYLVFGNGYPDLRVYQTCIDYDVRRRKHGFELATRLSDIAAAGGHSRISLWCADDLDANNFWRSLGFVLVAKRRGGVKRGRVHHCWQLPLITARQQNLFGNEAAFIASQAAQVHK